MRLLLLSTFLFMSFFLTCCKAGDPQPIALPVMQNAAILLEALDWKATPSLEQEGNANRSFKVLFGEETIRGKSPAEIRKWVGTLNVQELNFVLWDSVSYFTSLQNAIEPQGDPSRIYRELIRPELKDLLSQKEEIFRLERKITNFLQTCNHPPVYELDSVKKEVLFRFDNTGYSVDPDKYARLCMAYFFRGKRSYQQFACEYFANGVRERREYRPTDPMFDFLYKR